MRIVERRLTLDAYRNGTFVGFHDSSFIGTMLDVDLLETTGVLRIVVLDLSGALIGTEPHELSDLVKQVLDSGERALAINLAAVTDVDSEGLSEIVRSYTTFRRGGGAISFVNPPDRLRQLVASLKFL